MEENNIAIIARILTNKKMVIALTILFILVFSGYMAGFSQLPIAHDTFHELRHSIGLSCH